MPVRDRRRWRRTLTVWGIALIALLLAPERSSHAQRPAPTFRSGVDVVQLDVSVLDKERRPVKGLTAADFTVVANGAPQTIVAFDAVDIQDVDETAAPWVREAPLDVVTNDAGARRVMVIVLDDAHMPFDGINMAKQVAHDVISGLGPQDLAAVAFTDSGRRQDITADRRQLRAAVDSLIPHPGPGSLTPAAVIGMKAQVGTGPASGMSQGAGPCGSRGKWHTPYACLIDTLVTAGEALRTAPLGRKTLVLISAGVPMDFSHADGLRGDGNPWEEGLAIQTVLKTLQEANVNIYAIDPSGLTPEGIMGPRLDSLRMFSEETGGRVTLATNAPAQAVPQIFRENSSYYMLGIPASDADRGGGFRRVEVNVNRPGVEVRSRSGYYAIPKAAAGRARTPSLVDAAMNHAVPGGNLALGLTVAPFAMTGQRAAAVAVAIEFRDPPSLGRPIEVEARALDADCGDCRKLPSRHQTLMMLQASGSAHPEVMSRLDLAPGRYEIRVAASVEGRSGMVFAHVDVPDFGKDRLSASGLVLGSKASGVVEQKSLMGDVIPIVPTTAREFSAGAPISAFIRLYQGGSKPPAAVGVTATIRDDHDETKFTRTTTLEPATFARTRSSDVQLDLPIATLRAGAHLLSIEAHLGDATIQRDARFTIR